MEPLRCSSVNHIQSTICNTITNDTCARIPTNEPKNVVVVMLWLSATCANSQNMCIHSSEETRDYATYAINSANEQVLDIHVVMI